MNHAHHIDARSAMIDLMAAFEEFDGTCDPAFDNDYEELERTFAELRLAYGNQFN